MASGQAYPYQMSINFILERIHTAGIHTIIFRAGSNYTKLYQLQLHYIFYFNYNYNYIHNFPNQLQLQLHCFNYNYIMRNQIYSAFVNYVFLRILLNFNIFYTIDKQI